MLRRIRIAAAIFFFTFITLLFLDFTGTIHHWFGWMTKIQFFPALLALNVGIVAFLVVLTLLFGRIYCSVICPLGVFQDTISWAAGKKKKNRFSYSPAVSWLRYGALGLFIVAIFAGLSVIVSLLEPYSAYGRIASNLFAPVWQLGNNLLAFVAQRIDSYTFYSVDIWLKGGIPLGVAILTVIILAILAWRNGRTYCNTICPVGTVLGFFSRFSLFKPVILTNKCNSCGLCARNCKASCIDAKAHHIDYTRCVTCMDCIGKCNKGTIRYKIAGKKAAEKQEETVVTRQAAAGKKENARRNFLSVTAMLAAGAALKAKEVLGDGGFVTIIDKKRPKRTTPITPPGSGSARNLNRNCTACQLCISACPNQILRPSTNLDKLMQPEVSYERGYCRPECTRCSEVCPTGAIRRITTADKSALQIGRAVWIRDNCLVNRDSVQCNNCYRHCPTGAIQQVPIDPNNEKSLKIPAVDVERCIGCGACENLCPSRPLSAIYLEGNLMHRTI
ncbi:MAG: 4Fe-4S dicluster domain-containing protein [Bacteroides sp.]|nr:4Fe-4S dicluster domain-containing protein [Bacteroides sp.]